MQTVEQNSYPAQQQAADAQNPRHIKNNINQKSAIASSNIQITSYANCKQTFSWKHGFV